VSNRVGFFDKLKPPIDVPISSRYHDILMAPRRRIENAAFYTDSSSRCRAWIRELASTARATSLRGELCAGIVPHAGWRYSGAVALEVWKNLQSGSQPDVIIVFGAVHYPGVRRNSAYPGGSWDTPLGPIPVDGVLTDVLKEKLEQLLDMDARAHDQEHSIEVQLPFVKNFFPDSRVLPIAVPPGPPAVLLGQKIAEATQDLPVIAVGSTDLTHYGERYHFAPEGSGRQACDWMLGNDRRMIDLMLGIHADDVLSEARGYRNACGPGAIAATLSFARSRGISSGELLRHTTSHEVEKGSPENFNMAVGYAGIVF